MQLPHAVPCPEGTDRARRAKELRDLATEISRTRPHVASRSNGEEIDLAAANFPSNFTKGLYHNEFGVLASAKSYSDFVEAINSEDQNLFVSREFGADYTVLPSPLFRCTIGSTAVKWRGWESPRAGHVYELEGPDAGSVGMAPAPRVGSSELAAEMAELYGLAILRDVPFTEIAGGTSKKRLCEGNDKAVLSTNQIVTALNSMPFYSGTGATSSTPGNSRDGLNQFERNRRFARTQDDTASLTAPLTTATVFRGSTPGALVGPYISQFLLIGSPGLAGAGAQPNAGNFPGTGSGWDIRDGFVNYGTLAIDQRTVTHKGCLDHMTEWTHWLDAQNGANFKGANSWEGHRRFITTPRDLATYVHFDALYEAYLNAVLIIDSLGVPTARGFPEQSFAASPRTSQRTGFATFGGPHVLSLVTEVATRCLKAVRRQKFSYHRRGRPEALGGRLTLIDCGVGSQLKTAEAAFQHFHDEIPATLRAAIVEHNKKQNTAAMTNMRAVKCPSPVSFPGFSADHNLLLPMAFPEGSPMHPAYGAGHATVAGGCVTMVKAFFEMFEDAAEGVERPLLDKAGAPIVYVPNADGSKLVAVAGNPPALTVQGELDKLAANIAIGRNMAGVHFYSDYYDSLRLGERVAVGILLEQAPTYGDAVQTSFRSFDGDLITIAGQRGTAAVLTILDRHGTAVAPRDWWLRHVLGEHLILDL